MYNKVKRIILILILGILILGLLFGFFYYINKKCNLRVYDNFQNISQDIPKIIHQIWFTWQTKEPPSNFQQWSNNCKSIHHDGWEHKMWNDEDSRNFIKNNYPEFLDIYDGYDKNIKRVDAVRYYFLYHFGGVYMDMDFICLKNLEPLLEKGKVIFGSQHKNKNAKEVIANAFMASPPGHPLFKQLINNLYKTKNRVNVVEATGPVYLTENINEYTGNDVVNATGPVYLTENINKYTGNDIVIYKLPIIYTHKWNEKDNKLKDCEKDIELCKKHFPNSYTTTAWTGTWTGKKI